MLVTVVCENEFNGTPTMLVAGNSKEDRACHTKIISEVTGDFSHNALIRVFVHSVRIRRGLIQAWKVRVSFNLSSSRRSLMLLQLRRMLSSSGLGVSGQMKVICPGSDLNFTLASSLTSE